MTPQHRPLGEAPRAPLALAGVAGWSRARGGEHACAFPFLRPGLLTVTGQMSRPTSAVANSHEDVNSNEGISDLHTLGACIAVKGYSGSAKQPSYPPSSPPRSRLELRGSADRLQGVENRVLALAWSQGAKQGGLE